MRIEQGVASITSRQFNHDVGAAKRAAAVEPVIITDRGEPAYVLLTYDSFRRLAGERPNLVDMLRMHGDVEIEFEPGRADIVSRVPDFDELAP